MARTGLVHLIEDIRDMCNVGTADWSDDEIQTVLDRHRIDVHRERLHSEPAVTEGTVEYFDFYSQYSNFEQTDGGTDVFVLEDSDGYVKGAANWTANYVMGRVRFTNDQGGTSIYLTGRSYRMNAAAAQVWRQQAGKQADKYSFSSDGQSMSRSDWFKHCNEMARYYDGLSAPTTVRMVRSDLN